MTSRWRAGGAAVWAASVLTAMAVAVTAAGCTSLPPREAESPRMEMSRILERDAVLVRGWLGEADAGLEPVIPLATAPAGAGEAAGPYRLRGFADNDEALFDVRLGEAGLVAVAGQAQRQFAAAVLVNPGGAQALARVVLEAGETSITRRAVRTAAELRAALAAVQISTLPDGRTGVRWDAGQFALLQLSDPATGSVLALDRDGEVTVTAPHGALEVALSDGVRSAAALFALR